MGEADLERQRQKQMAAGQVAAEARAVFNVASREGNLQIKRKALRAEAKALASQNPPTSVRQSRSPSETRSDYWK